MTAARGASHRKLVFIAVLLLSAALLFCGFSSLFPPDGAAYASGALPDGYYAAAGEDGDWYFSEEYLDIAGAVGMVAGLREKYDFSAVAEDPVVIAVIDTGVNTDAEIFGTGTDNDVFLRNAVGDIVGRNTVDNNADISDGATADSHGTHVTGILALLIRALGLTDCVKIMPVKAGEYVASLGGSGNSFDYNDVARAIDFALENGADVVNLSLGTDNALTTSRWKDIVSESDSEQAVFVAAAGNYANSSGFKPFYPAASENVIGVMNYEESEHGARLHYVETNKGSNYGTLYDVCAPGTDIVSADGKTGGYKAMSGTSMASPAAAFAVALTALKCRLTGFDTSPDELREMFDLTFRDTMEYDGEEYPLLSVTGALEAEFARDASGNVYLASAADAEAAFSPDSLTLGGYGTLTLTADEDWLDTGALYRWDYESGGMSMTAYGSHVTIGIDVREPGEVQVVLSVYTPDGAELLARKQLNIPVEYFVPTAENSSLTLSMRADDDGTVTLSEGETLVLGVDTLRYASPDTETVWYVNGREASREQSFEFDPAEDGVYTLFVTVNGDRIGDEVTVVAEGRGSARDRAAMIGGICGGVGGAVLIAAAIVVAVHSARKKKAASGGGNGE